MMSTFWPHTLHGNFTPDGTGILPIGLPLAGHIFSATMRGFYHLTYNGGVSKETLERITLNFIASNDDPFWRSSEYQASLSEVEKALRALDKGMSVRMDFQESVDASSFLRGGFTILKSVASAAVPAVGAWLLGRAGRKVRLKIGDMEAEAHSVAEIKELLKEAENVRPRIRE